MNVDVDALEMAIGFAPEATNGIEDKGYCPLPLGMHNNGDTTGKFSINRDKQVYNCWVCGGGNFVKLAMEMNDMTEDQAKDWLRQFTNAESGDTEAFVSKIAKIFSEAPGRRDMSATLPLFNASVLDKWLVTKHPWLDQRKISAEVASQFKIGFNPAHYRYGYSGPAIILPHWWKGELVGWQERWLDDSRPEQMPKYTNTDDFPRKETLWGYDYAKEGDGDVLVVESVPTALYLIGLGYRAVATFGAKVTEGQTRLLRAFQGGITLCPDNGSAGIDNYTELGDKLRRYIRVTITDPPVEAGPKGDLGDLSDTPDLVHKYIEEATWHFVRRNQ